MSWRIRIAAAVMVFGPWGVWSQPRCQSQFDWMQGPSSDDDPCRLASILETMCAGPPGQHETTLPSLAPLTGDTYSVVKLNDTSSCSCNTVVYSLLSACALCQLASINTWTNFSAGCPVTFMNCFPIPIGQYTRVLPAWTLMDYTSMSEFDITAAQSMSALPSPSPTASIVDTSPAYWGTCYHDSRDAAEPYDDKNRPQAHYIIIEVIAGVLVLALVSLCVIYAWASRTRAPRERTQPGSTEAAEKATIAPPQTAQVPPSLVSTQSSKPHPVPAESESEGKAEEVVR